MSRAHDYHSATKHHFHRFARSLGYLDWATQPDPFRRYAGAQLVELPRAPWRTDVPYSALFDGSTPAAPFDRQAVGEFLRCAMGLSAWKQYQASRWALRVNPSSGNLHPTETYVVWNGQVCHYAPREHLLEVRAELPGGSDAWRDGLIVGLTSILWREAWKYGERAFRYCQHDVGHALGALRCSAALLGWTVRPLDWPDADIATLLGVDRDDDFADAEREEAECLLVVHSRGLAESVVRERLLETARRTSWQGRANTLSRAHVPWDAVEAVALATRKEDSERVEEGRGFRIASGEAPLRVGERQRDRRATPGAVAVSRDRREVAAAANARDVAARRVILQRRSAVAFDARSSLTRERLFGMLARLRPDGAPFDVLDTPTHVHLVLFVHRVDGLVPGVYAWIRDGASQVELQAAARSEFLWERIDPRPSREVSGTAPSDASTFANEASAFDEPHALFLLVPADVRFTANRLSCDQDIASDGFFSLAMLARFDTPLRDHGDWMYRRLFWECGVIGQVLYLEAEAAGARATGIGCFYDDAVHELLGLQGTSWQSLYHFSMGVPVDDDRIATEQGYEGAW